MKAVDCCGKYHYEIVGARETEAAQALEEALTAVSKRRNAYIDEELQVVMSAVAKTYGVEISMVSDHTPKLPRVYAGRLVRPAL